MRLHVKQTQRTRYQHLVYVRVDLGEVGGFERHQHAKFGQTITELRPAFIQHMHGFQPARLQPPLQAGAVCRKTAQARQVVTRQRLHVPQHQRCHSIAASQLNLRQGFPGVHAAYQRAQRQQQIAHMPWQYMALAHIGDIAAFAFMKTNQHLALFAHITNRQPRPVTIAPGRALDGAHHSVGPELAQVPEVVFQHALLDRYLRAHMQVLHLAAATGAGMQPEMRALRAHPLRRLAQHRHQCGFFKTRFLAIDAGADRLERQRAVDENHFAVIAVRNALGFDVERLDGEHVRRVVCQGCRRRLLV